MNLSRLLITILVSIMVCSSAWGQGGHIERLILEDRDAYEISFGPYVECFIGQHNLIVPIWLTNEEPVDYIHLILEFDPSLVEMLVIAPTLFYQHFRYGFLTDGRVEIEVEGKRGLIEELIKEIKVGNRWADVRDIKIDWQPYQGKYTRFDITF